MTTKAPQRLIHLAPTEHRGQVTWPLAASLGGHDVYSVIHYATEAEREWLTQLLLVEGAELGDPTSAEAEMFAKVTPGHRTISYLSAL